jgi:methionine synthase I (cobalamin-dependent)
LKISPHTNRRYLDALADHVVVFDGAMGTSVQACHLGRSISAAKRSTAATIIW